MNETPQWDVRAFDCEIEPFHLSVTGSVTHVTRDGWQPENETYVVAVTIRGYSFKFPIQRLSNAEGWRTGPLTKYDKNGRIMSLDTFVMANGRIDFLFEEALINLASMNHGVDQ